jgi:hypothetical protein
MRGHCERGSRSSGRRPGAPASWRPMGPAVPVTELMLAAAVTFRMWLPSAGRSRQADQATRFAARGRVPDAVRAGAGAFCLVMAHETPGDSRVRALLPLPNMRSIDLL